MHRQAAGTHGRVSRTEGEAAAARRAEDASACAILGATPAWLPFGSVDYERHGDESAVRAAISAVADGVDALLLPGFPLSHPDHDWLGRALVGGRMGCRRLGIYVEQPYGRRTDDDPRVPSWAEAALGARPVFRAAPAGSTRPAREVESSPGVPKPTAPARHDAKPAARAALPPLRRACRLGRTLGSRR